MEIKKMHVGVLGIVMAALIFIACPAYAVTDELYLTGTVTDIDVMHKTVTINVTDSNCPGTRKFIVDNVATYEELVNERITFFIDSFICQGDEVYKVLSFGRKMR